MFDNLLMIIPHGFEWIFIVLAIVVLIFGYKKIPELARSFGKASAEFEKARIQSKKELDDLKDTKDLAREKLESIAETLDINHTGKNNIELEEEIKRKMK